jgi:hypothetical protein
VQAEAKGTKREEQRYGIEADMAETTLRESGFIQVQVTGKTGDGGIDGKGVV